jgi:hypothetical protein
MHDLAGGAASKSTSGSKSAHSLITGYLNTLFLLLAVDASYESSDQKREISAEQCSDSRNEAMQGPSSIR